MKHLLTFSFPNTHICDMLHSLFSSYKNFYYKLRDFNFGLLYFGIRYISIPNKQEQTRKLMVKAKNARFFLFCHSTFCYQLKT